MEPPVYFVGLTLPNAFERKVVAAQKELFDTQTIRRPLIPHITLLPPPVFQGVDEDHFTARAQEVAQTLLPFTITLGATMYGQNSIRINVEPSEQLSALHEALVDLLPTDKRPAEPFVPHITLAQPKGRDKLSKDLLEDYTAKLSTILPVSYEVRNLALFTWRRPRVYSIRFLSRDGA